MEWLASIHLRNEAGYGQDNLSIVFRGLLTRSLMTVSRSALGETPSGLFIAVCVFFICTVVDSLK